VITLQIHSAYFTAGIVLENGTVTRCAPILSYMHGWMRGKVEWYCAKKGWKIVNPQSTIFNPQSNNAPHSPH
jgi:hypothetical protein